MTSTSQRIIQRQLGSDFRLKLYRWEYQDTDFFDIAQDKEIQSQAEECANQLLPLLKPLLNGELDVDRESKTVYLVTLLMAARKMETSDLSRRLSKRLIPLLSKLPESHYKTYLQTYLYMTTGNERFFANAYESAASWDAETMTEEDGYILRFLKEEKALINIV